MRARVAQQTAAGPALELTSHLLALVDSFPWPTPRVRARRPDATFRIAGKQPAGEVAALASSPGVTVTG